MSFGLQFHKTNKLKTCRPLFCGINRRTEFIGKAAKLSILFLFLYTISSFLNPLNLLAQSAGGGYAESYLLRNIGARPLSMAGAYTAVVNDPNALFYNPAGLSLIETVPQFTTMHSFLEFGRTHSSIAWGQSFNDEIGAGFAINNFTSGSFVGRDVMGNKLGDFTDWQFALVGGLSYRIEYASVGVAVKYLANSLEGSGIRADGFALDIGTKFNILDLMSVGVCVQNISGVMFWNTKDETVNLIPYSIRVGAATEFGLNDEEYVTRSTITGELEKLNIPATRYILLGLDAVMTQYENAPTVVLGVEAVVHEIIAFRGGIALAGDDMNTYKLLPMTIWGAGISLRPRDKDLELNLPFDINFDYTISADKLARNNIAHSLSLVFIFK